MDYEFQHGVRCCSATGRQFTPGETYYSVLVAEGVELKRYDYAADAWRGPPETAIGWWQSQVPDAGGSRKHWATNDVMLQFWDELAKEPDKGDMRYVLTLLLARRRVFRFEGEKGRVAPAGCLERVLPATRCQLRSAAGRAVARASRSDTGGACVIAPLTGFREPSDYYYYYYY